MLLAWHGNPPWRGRSGRGACPRLLEKLGWGQPSDPASHEAMLWDRLGGPGGHEQGFPRPVLTRVQTLPQGPPYQQVENPVGGEEGKVGRQVEWESGPCGSVSLVSLVSRSRCGCAGRLRGGSPQLPQAPRPGSCAHAQGSCPQGPCPRGSCPQGQLGMTGLRASPSTSCGSLTPGSEAPRPDEGPSQDSRATGPWVGGLDCGGPKVG